jgi:hypothetical protein
VVTPLGRHWPEYVQTTKRINKHYRLSRASCPIVEPSPFQWVNLSKCLSSLTFNVGNRSTFCNAVLKVLPRVLVTIDLVNRFIDHLRVVTTNNYNSIADSHITVHFPLRPLSLIHLLLLGNRSQQWIFLCSVFTRRFLVRNLNNGDSSAFVAAG